MRLAPTSRTLAAALLLTELAAGRDIPIVVLHTTDLHGRLVNLLPEPNVAPEAGLLRCASRIRFIRAERRHVLYIDVGDTIQGTPESLAAGGRIMLDALARAGCDAWVPGNHEFDWGADLLRGLIERAPFPTLAANLRPPPRSAGQPAWRHRAWVAQEFDGVRVAVVGTTHPTIPWWTPAALLDGVRIDPSEEAIAELLPELRAARPDILILAVHEGARAGRSAPSAGAMALSRRFPEFDIVLGGHTHEAIPELRLPSGALYSQAGCHGQWLGRIDIVFDTVRRRIARATGVLLPVDASVEPDPELAAAAAPHIEKAERDLGVVLARWDGPPPARGAPGDEPVARLLRQAIADAVGAEVVIHGRLSDADIPAGEITARDLWRWVPYENRIGVCRLTAGDIRAILEESFRQPAGRAAAGVTGLLIDLDEGAQEEPRVVRILLPNGEPPHARRRFRVAFNSYALASAGGRLPDLHRIAHQPEAAMELTEMDTREAVRRWLTFRRRITEASLPPPGYRPARRDRSR